MIEPLLALPGHLRSRLGGALSAGLLRPPYTSNGIRSALGGGTDTETETVLGALIRCERRGVSGAGIALALETARGTAASAPRTDLVWSGPEADGLRARDTRRVYEELVAGATETIWISTYAYWDGPRAFRSLAERMTERSDLSATLLLNIGRRPGDSSTDEERVSGFAARFWDHDWPGERRPAVFYDPRSLDPGSPGGVLHAKAIVVDEQAALVTSANLTEAAFDRNIEVGVLSRDRALAASLVRHFRVLIDRQLLSPL